MSIVLSDEETVLPLSPEQETLRLRQRVHKLNDTVQEHVGEFIRVDEHLKALDLLIRQGPDVENIQFNTRTVMWLIAFLTTMIAGMYASTYGIRSDVRDIRTNQEMRDRIDLQKEKVEVERAKGFEERLTALRQQLIESKTEQNQWRVDMQAQMKEILAMINPRRAP